MRDERAAAKQVHETIMALLHSNWAAVTTTADRIAAAINGRTLEGSNLVVSAQQGRQESGAQL